MKNNLRKVNTFFDKVYGKEIRFAFSPIIGYRSDDSDREFIKSFAIAAAIFPVTVVAMCVTIPLAIVSAILTALVHSLAKVFATIFDKFESKIESSFSPS